MSDADAEHRAHMCTKLVAAAERLGVALTGEPVFGWIDDGQHSEIAVALHANARQLIRQWEGRWQ